MSVNKKRGVSAKKPPSLSHCTYSTFTDKKKITITLDYLNKCYDSTKKVNQKAFLSFGIRRSENEIFFIEGELKLERRIIK